MELVFIESTKVTYLVQLHNPAGMIYQPEAAVKIAERYSFAKMPTVDDLFKNERVFRIGKFGDVQISEFAIYTDGVVVQSACDSAVIDAFIDDIFGWAREEFGLIPISISKPEKTYESSIIVRSDIDIAEALRPKVNVFPILNRVYQTDKYTSSQIYPTGIIGTIDEQEFEGRKKPIKFILDRRIGVDFDQMAFFSQAPLQTKDHFAVLREFERAAAEG
jgi:hypothetical protein